MYFTPHFEKNFNEQSYLNSILFFLTFLNWLILRIMKTNTEHKIEKSLLFSLSKKWRGELMEEKREIKSATLIAIFIIYSLLINAPRTLNITHIEDISTNSLHLTIL